MRRSTAITLLFALAAVLGAGLVSCGGNGNQASEQAATKAGKGNGAANEPPVSGRDVETFGEKAGVRETKAALTVLSSFMAARAAGQWVTECGYAGAPAIEPLEELVEENPQYKDKPCPVLVAALAELQSKKALKDNFSGSITLRTDGEKAFALYRSSEGGIYAMPMVQEGGAWKVASLTAEPAH